MTRIALVQMVVREGDPEANVARARGFLATAPEADVYLLPELWSSGYSHGRWPEIADQSTPEVLEWMTTVAAAKQAYLGGSLITRRRSDQALVNRFWIIAPDGKRVSYDKGHLFAPLKEDTHLRAGTSRVRTNIHGWNAALSLCFDLRFPEQYRLDAVDGAELFLVASEWPEPRCNAFTALVRARAIENQAVLAVCNRLGPGEPDLTYCGNSVIVGPDGTILAAAGQDECVVMGEVDKSMVEHARSALPVLPLRAPGLDWMT
jgi:omega-amidase